LNNGARGETEDPWGHRVAFCIAPGVGPTTTVQAQEAAPHAFLVAIESIHDMDTFTRAYGPRVPATLQPYGTRGTLTNLEGEAPGRFIIIEFNSLQNAAELVSIVR
jgi:hypothetical protein